MADRTTSRIAIAAPRESVLDVIADFAAYPQWATGIRSAEVVDPGTGGRARSVRFRLDAGFIKDSCVLRYDWNAPAGVRWQLAEPGSMISELTGAYLLADDQMGSMVTYELSVGLKIPMLGMVKRHAEKAIIDAALRGLKSRAEGVQAGGAARTGSGGRDD
jgi:carbon monoxide dehydrogenase subunit G